MGAEVPGEPNGDLGEVPPPFRGEIVTAEGGTRGGGDGPGGEERAARWPCPPLPLLRGKPRRRRLKSRKFRKSGVGRSPRRRLLVVGRTPAVPEAPEAASPAGTPPRGRTVPSAVLLLVPFPLGFSLALGMEGAPGAQGRLQRGWEEPGEHRCWKFRGGGDPGRTSRLGGDRSGGGAGGKRRWLQNSLPPHQLEVLLTSSPLSFQKKGEGPSRGGDSGRWGQVRPPRHGWASGAVPWWWGVEGGSLQQQAAEEPLGLCL